MEKKILSEQLLIFGDVAMPKGFEIDQDKLMADTIESSLTNKEFSFSRNWDMLNTYIREHVYVEYKIKLSNKKSWSDTYKPNTLSKPLLNINQSDLGNSPDFTTLYGTKVNNCQVKIYYDDNRRKGKSWDIKLKENMFIMFPSNNIYTISNEQKDSLNFIQTITYNYL